MRRPGFALSPLLAILLVQQSSAFLTPAVWSRIQTHLRFFGQSPSTSFNAMGGSSRSTFGGRWGGAREEQLAFTNRLMKLEATAPMSFGDFAGDEMNFAELREQLMTLENQLASAMNLGE